MKIDFKIIVAYFKGFVNGIVALFKKKSAKPVEPTQPPVVTTPPVPTAIPPSQTNGLDLSTVSGWSYQQVVMRVGRPLTPEEYAYAVSFGMVPIEQPPVPVDPVPPPTGAYNDISDPIGGVKVFVLNDNQAQEVIANPAAGGKTVRVFGASGTQILSLTDANGTRELAGTMAWYDAPMGNSYTFSVTSRGNHIAVMLY